MFRRILSAMGISATGPEDPESFTRMVAAVFQREDESAKVEVTGPLQLAVTRADGATHSVYLDNLYQLCVANPEGQEEQVTRFAKALMNVSAEETTLPKNVVPVVRDRAFVDEMLTTMRNQSKGEKAPPEMYFEELGADLIVLYVRDDPHSTSFLFQEQIEELHLAGQTLRELGIDNLHRILPEIKSEGANGLHFFSADNCYEPSLLLSDRIWEKFRQHLKGELVFGVPARGVLAVADSAIPEAVAFLQKSTRELFEQQPYRISDKIYIRHADGKVDFYNPEHTSLST